MKKEFVERYIYHDIETQRQIGGKVSTNGSLLAPNNYTYGPGKIIELSKGINTVGQDPTPSSHIIIAVASI
jgi:hypothetical protein